MVRFIKAILGLNTKKPYIHNNVIWLNTTGFIDY